MFSLVLEAVLAQKGLQNATPLSRNFGLGMALGSNFGAKVFPMGSKSFLLELPGKQFACRIRTNGLLLRTHYLLCFHVKSTLWDHAHTVRTIRLYCACNKGPTFSSHLHPRFNFFIDLGTKPTPTRVLRQGGTDEKTALV